MRGVLSQQTAYALEWGITHYGRQSVAEITNGSAGLRRILGVRRDYAWGSPTQIPQILDLPQDSRPFAEMWFGAHPSGASALVDSNYQSLDAVIAADPESHLGDDVVARFGPRLPYLLKVLSAERPLSLQVHPTVAQARVGYEREESAGISPTSTHRQYPDANHKPELIFALTKFNGLCGFRAPRRAAELLTGLDAPLAQELVNILRQTPDAGGVRAAFSRILHPETRATAREVGEIVEACAAREAADSPSPRTDRIVQLLAEHYPGDPGVVTSLLLNPVTLQPGEALFIPAGCVHAYLHGTGVEVMASSDNVLRAGLTPKHIDVEELLELVDCVAAPPIRIAPEMFNGVTRVFYAPVDDFELSVTDLDPAADAASEVSLPGRGPRIVLNLEGRVELRTATHTLSLERGQAAFISSDQGPVSARGYGRIVQADVP